MLGKILFALLVLTTPAFAQQDPQVAIYRQLLDQANANFAQALSSCAVQVDKAQTKVKELEDKYEPKKPEPKK